MVLVDQEGNVLQPERREEEDKGRTKKTGDELVRWHNKRMGKSEEAHSIMKEDLAGGRLPSSEFGENAAWWWIMILSLNLNNAFKALVLGEQWLPLRMKSLRFRFLRLTARVLERGRKLFVRIKDYIKLRYLLDARQKISRLAQGPSPSFFVAGRCVEDVNLKEKVVFDQQEEKCIQKGI